MKDVDLSAIRSRLPRGSINIIADQLSIDPKIVSHVFTHGWYSQYKDQVVQAALSIIKDKTEATKSLIKDADGLGLTATTLRPIPKKAKRKDNVPRAEAGFADYYDLTREELEDFIKDNGLTVDPDDYSDFWKGSEKNRMELLYAICDEIGADVPDWDDVHDETRENLEDIIDNFNLEIDLTDYDDDVELADRICEELCIESPEE